MQTDHVGRRMALLEGVELSEADIDSVVHEFGDFDRALAELATFAAGVEFPAMQMQPGETDRA